MHFPLIPSLPLLVSTNIYASRLESDGGQPVFTESNRRPYPPTFWGGRRNFEAFLTTLLCAVSEGGALFFFFFGQRSIQGEALGDGGSWA